MSNERWKCGRVSFLSDQGLTKTKPPLFAVFKLPGDPSGWSMTHRSLDVQTYRNLTIVAGPDDCEANAWLLLLRPGDRLPAHALQMIAGAIVEGVQDADIVYWDDDEVDAAGNHLNPRFKPDWSRLHLEATNYIGRSVALRVAALREKDLWPRNEEELRKAILILTQHNDGVVHIPEILLHRPAGEEQPIFGRVPVSLPDSPPTVSIVIPTRDAVDLLRQCVDGVLSKTTYPHYEIVVVDNGSRDSAALNYLTEIDRLPQVRVLRYDRPFNYSAINNYAVGQVSGEVLCLLNNDTEVISSDWLDEMVGHLCREKVGVVGAKLYYPDGRIQHGGVVVGPGGCANHLHQYWPGDSPGYCNRAIVAQELSAVTAACMVTWRKLYLKLGGLNERWLPVAFNDVDYCLRVRQAGYKVVWTPHAELYHHESFSRGKDRGWRKEFRAWREVRYMRWKWRKEMKCDPFYNVNFDYKRADFSVRSPPGF